VTLLHPGELANIRTTRSFMFDAEAVIQRNIAGTWTTIATPPCSYSQAPILPQENPSQTQRLFIDDRWRFIFAAGTDVRFGDRLVVGARAFEVIQVPIPSRELSRLAIAQELTA
jgi:hypothetical protein